MKKRGSSETMERMGIDMKQATRKAIKAILAQARSYGSGSIAAYEQGKRLLQALDISAAEYQEAIKELARVARV